MKKFAFLIHPRDIFDVYRPLPWARIIPPSLLTKLIGAIPKNLNVHHWGGFDVYGKAEGHINIVFLTGEQMVSLPRKYVQERILEAVLLAQDKFGAEVVGLGAYTAPLTDAGKWLIRQPNVKVAITHGDSFSVAIAYQGVLKLASKFKVNLRESKVAIVGSYGLIGEALTKLLIKECRSLILIGRRPFKLEAQKKSLESEQVSISTDISEVAGADIIVTSTSYPGSLLKSDYLRKGVIIYDIAQPINVEPNVCKARPDIIRIDGCYAMIPGIDLKYDMGPPKGATFSCLAETIMQSLENDMTNHVGEIDLSHVKKTIEWQKKYGFEHAQFTNYSRPLIP
jgi:fatty aldehyde-generating acyl-ACP reductase